MDQHHLVEMANQIGRFYSAEPDEVQAMLDTASHLRRFWDPRMRVAFYAWIDEQAGAGLDPFVLEAARIHRAMLEPKAPSPRAPA